MSESALPQPEATHTPGSSICFSLSSRSRCPASESRPRAGRRRLVSASAYLITRAADHSVTAVLLTAITAGIAYGTRINPLWALAAAAAIGLAGYVGLTDTS